MRDDEGNVVRAAGTGPVEVPGVDTQPPDDGQDQPGRRPSTAPTPQRRSPGRPAKPPTEPDTQPVDEPPKSGRR
jgi:hypothetical protein